MANDYYDHGAYPATGVFGKSADARAEFEAVEQGFDKMPALTGNAYKIAYVNSSATAWGTLGGTGLVKLRAASIPILAVDGTDYLSPTGAATVTNKTLVVASNTITTAASGNLAATELNAALAELDGQDTTLQGNIDTLSSSTTAALALKAPLASPTFTGDPKAPTPALGDNDTSIVTSAFVMNAFANGFGGGAFGAKNAIINPSGVIQQRVAPTLTSSVQYGPDRWLGSISGGTGISGTFTKSAFSGSVSGYGIWLSSTSFTSGTPYFAQRMESFNVVKFNGKTVTISGRIYQDTGSSQDFVIDLRKADVLDTYGSSTVIATSSPIAVASGGAGTAFSVNFTLGASDATKGLVLEIFLNSSITVSSKNFAISDIQFEEGAFATPLELRPVGVELVMCQRYYEAPVVRITGYSNAGAAEKGAAYFKVTKRIIPAISLNTAASSNVGSGSVPDVSTEIVTSQHSVTATGAFFFNDTLAANAEL